MKYIKDEDLIAGRKYDDPVTIAVALAPAADVVEVKHSTWGEPFYDGRGWRVPCLNCCATVPMPDKSNYDVFYYCPLCAAQMDLQVEAQ